MDRNLRMTCVCGHRGGWPIPCPYAHLIFTDNCTCSCGAGPQSLPDAIHSGLGTPTPPPSNTVSLPPALGSTQGKRKKRKMMARVTPSAQRTMPSGSSDRPLLRREARLPFYPSPQPAIPQYLPLSKHALHIPSSPPPPRLASCACFPAEQLGSIPSPPRPSADVGIGPSMGWSLCCRTWLTELQTGR